MTNEHQFEIAPLPSNPVEAQLDLLRRNLAVRTYPHYPAANERFYAEPSDLAKEHGRLVLPDGTWTIDTHPRQRVVEHTPDTQTQSVFRQQGLELDSLGRPLHPWMSAMIRDPSIGVVMGKGAYWKWGPNYTADSIVVCRDHILLVKRKDTGLWALPGGHVDPGEAAKEAAPREVAEESGVTIPTDREGLVVYHGPVVDLRATAHAWPETTAFLYQLEGELPSALGMDDAAEAAWVPLEVINQEDTLFGSHRFLLQQAQIHLKSPSL